MSAVYRAIFALFIILILNSPPLLASEPSSQTAPPIERKVHLVSTDVGCILINAGSLNRVTSTVRLRWQGQVETASVKLAVYGSEGGHSIFVNGQRIGQVPARAGETPCVPGQAEYQQFSTDSISIPVEILNNGDNTITLTNDADSADGWVAASLYLEITGDLTGPPVGAMKAEMASQSTSVVPLATPCDSHSHTMVSTYDGVSHTFQYYTPSGSSPVPLVVGLHPMGFTSTSMIIMLCDEVTSRGWALVSPDMHGMTNTNSGKDALAWVGAQHDVIDAINYMRTNFNIDLTQIYVVGQSMGAQTTTVMVAKYPDVFAAAGEWMGFTDVSDWHAELLAQKNMGHDFFDLLDRTEYETGGTPSTVPFEYQRRSSMQMAMNMIHLPMHIWHDKSDLVVPRHHTDDITNTVNSLKAGTITRKMVEEACPGNGYPPSPDESPYGHCLSPDAGFPSFTIDDLFGYLNGRTRNIAAPQQLHVRTDESKSYFWLDIDQTGGDHWTEVNASFNAGAKTLAVTATDTHPVTLKVNLGSTALSNSAGIPQAGLGLPAGDYRITGGGLNQTVSYVSGYLTISPLVTGQYTISIAPAPVLEPVTKSYLPLIIKK